MSGAALIRELGAMGTRFRSREAAKVLLFAVAAAAGIVWLAALSDVWLRHGRAGRVVAAVLWLVPLGWGALRIRRELRRAWPPAAVAARVERAIPELDNRLINYVQFAGREGEDAMIAACVQQGVPEWASLPFERLRDPRPFRYAAGALAVAAVAMALSAFWTGGAWVNALMRVVNPLSSRPPVTLAKILDVTPGDRAVLAGTSVTLGVKVTGRPGQRVFLDLWPADDERSTVEIGRIAGSGDESFPYDVAKLTANLEYRFRAGDVTSDRHTVKAVPPPAFRKFAVRVIPPVYLNRKATDHDAARERFSVPQGSTLRFEVGADRRLAGASVAAGSKSVDLAPAADGVMTGSVDIAAATPLRVTIADENGYKAESEAQFDLEPDGAPAIRILVPQSRVRLGAGAVPRIQWEVTDDHGLGEVMLERLDPAKIDKPGERVIGWSPTGDVHFSRLWTGENQAVPTNGQPMAYRIVASDLLPGAAPRTVRSPPVFFDTAAAASASGSIVTAKEDLGNTLAHLVDMQRKNLDRTAALDKAADGAAPSWKTVRDVQAEIRDRAGKLIADPAKPLGAMDSLVRDLHVGPMDEVIRVSSRVSAAAEAERKTLSARSVALEGAILRALTAAESASGRVAQHQQITGLLALLDALVNGQTTALGAAQKSAQAKSKVPTSQVDQQDRLAQDTDEFVKACRKEAEAMKQNDAAFAETATRVAAQCTERKVSGTMLGASEKLEQDQPALAMPMQTTALNHLKEFQADLNKWRVADASEKMKSLQEAFDDIRERMKKLSETQAKVVDAIRQTDQQKDKSAKAMEELTEELDEIKGNMKEALLKIATDLHIFPELPVGNDLVTDVFQIYEEVAQVPGSESTEAKELGLQKEDWILEALETATKRVDDMEMWLVSQPDATKRNTENFDQQELPQIPVIPLASETEDIIGDLLEQEEEEANKADDSATNQGSADAPMGWGIAEGEFANFSAKGKSGNERPDHKDQDGRSIVGRQGMSDGETTAGSGKINEGDNNIEARRTQDSAQSGQVQEEGHAEAKATGGGKSSGYSDRKGMAGMGPRRDANTSARSELGWQAMLRRNAEQLYAKASMSHVRTGSLDDAIRLMKTAEDAMTAGQPIREVREYQRRAAAALRRTQAELGPGVYTAVAENERTGPAIEDQVAGAADDAPAEYRDLVADYFRSLSEVAP